MAISLSVGQRVVEVLTDSRAVLLSGIIVAALLGIASASLGRAARSETLLLPCLGMIHLLSRENLVSTDSDRPSIQGLYCFAHCCGENESPSQQTGLRLLSQSGVCTSALTGGHNRADSRIFLAHDDVASGKQESCGLDDFSN